MLIIQQRTKARHFSTQIKLGLFLTVTGLVALVGLSMTLSLQATERFLGLKGIATSSTNDILDRIISDEHVPNRTVPLLTKDNTPTGFGGSDQYSGMWWVGLDRFLSVDFLAIQNLEGFSFVILNTSPGTRLTRDWFDFCVEHQSYYHKLFRLKHPSQKDAYPILLEQMRSYVKKTKPYPRQTMLAPYATIATIPFTVQTFLHGPKDSSNEADQLRIHALAATLASMAQFGIARAVVVGRTLADGQAAETAFELFRNETNARAALMDIQLQFILGNENTTGIVDDGIVPRQALQGLKFALSGHYNETQQKQWLGDDPQRWRYVYYSEPDLVLSSRPGSVAALTTVLDEGLSMAAHRLHPIPHELDFPTLPNRTVVPAVGNFSNVSLVNSDEWVCCDAGRTYPGKDLEPSCGMFWWKCGFNFRPGAEPFATVDEVMAAFKGMLPYNLMRFETGTSSVMLTSTEHARRCTLLQASSCPPLPP